MGLAILRSLNGAPAWRCVRSVPMTATCATARSEKRSARSGRCRHLGGKILLFPFDAFAEGITNVARDLDRSADLALRLFDGLRHALVRRVDERLIEQADFLVEGLEP